MTIAALRKRIVLESPQRTQPKEFGPELLVAVSDGSAALVNSLQDGTVTVEQIDFFLQRSFEALPHTNKKDLLAALLCKKAWLLFRQGRGEDGLQQYEEALRIKEAPSTWASKGMDLLQAERLDEAFDAFRNSYSLREGFGPQKQAHLENLIGAWSVAALLRCLSGILEQDFREAEKGVFEYIELLDKTKKDKLEYMVLSLEVAQPVPGDIKAGLEELELMVRLLSIKDAFERWRAFTKEISKVWPEGVSAVDAIREQRE